MYKKLLKKCMKDLIVSSGCLRLLEENRRKALDKGVKNDFLDMTPKSPKQLKQ
jgi:hypothetical protein